jgi:UDP-2-acetamido-3-amino-2,3-dideoxy-glucuronate N-acetyltransferase
MNAETTIISKNAKVGKNTFIWHFTQIRENAKLGDNCIIGKGVYIDKDVVIGNNVKIQNNVSIYQGVAIEDGVFIGPHVCFTNDKNPRATNPDESLKMETDWKLLQTRVKSGASIGANSTIIAGVTIEAFALIGAGSVVTKDVPPYTLVQGNPARVQGLVCKCAKKLDTKRKKCEECNICLDSIPQ